MPRSAGAAALIYHLRRVRARASTRSRENRDSATQPRTTARGHSSATVTAAITANATTEEEYVILLEAHRKLVAVGKFAFNEETYAKLLPVAEAEYRMFLNKEATEGGTVNPVLLERITRREVEAGRLDPNDDLRTLAVSGASVLGDSAEITAHRCKQGDWFFYGMAVAAIVAAGFALVPLSPLWLIAVGLVVGWFLNERERKRIKASIAARRSSDT